MYKVFFDNRTIFLTNQFEKYYNKYNGLFIKYLNEIQLAYVLELFKSIEDIQNVFIIYHDVEKIFNEFQSFFRFVEAAGGLVTNEKGEYLVIKRRGKWDLPKGKLDKEENPDKAAIREVREECNVWPLKIHDILKTTYHAYILEGVLFLKRTYWYQMKHEGNVTPSPQTEEDITQAKWLKKEDLKIFRENTYQSILDVLKAGEAL